MSHIILFPLNPIQSWIRCVNFREFYSENFESGNQFERLNVGKSVTLNICYIHAIRSTYLLHVAESFLISELVCS